MRLDTKKCSKCGYPLYAGLAQRQRAPCKASCVARRKLLYNTKFYMSYNKININNKKYEKHNYFHI